MPTTLTQALASCWLGPLEEAGLLNVNPPRLALWLSTHAGPRPEDVALLRQRMSGRSTVEIGRQIGRRHQYVDAQTTSAAVGLLAPHMCDIAAWRAGRADGYTDAQIAELYDVEVQLVLLALDGWPQRERDEVTADDRATSARLWRRGAGLTEIADELGVSSARLRRLLATGELGLRPKRVRQFEIAERFGWSASLTKLARDRGDLPPPDSPAAASAAVWWWETTLDRFADERLAFRCGVCHARFGTARGASAHRAHMHG